MTLIILLPFVQSNHGWCLPFKAIVNCTKKKEKKKSLTKGLGMVGCFVIVTVCGENYLHSI